MNVIHRNVMIPIEALKPHPDNPRKDVGDITELAESIKANGVFQNLTVLKGDILDGYTVIIGHRRLAAARAAGLTELPCMVVEMDEREQISTMLLENMQRNDLTVYEQAQGFQMMLDLGETESDIAEKTGFSKTTIKHRLKLLELDPEEFRKSQERQPSMADYIELEKLTDPNLKKRALAKIGTKDFDWVLQSCVRDQRAQTICGEWLEYVDSLFVRVDFDDSRKIVKTIYMHNRITAEDKAQLDKMDEEDTEFVLDYSYTDGNNYLYILGKKLDKQMPKYEQVQKERDERKAKIKEVQSQAALLRKRFVKKYIPRQKNRSTLLCALFQFEIDLLDISWDEVAETLGITTDNEDGFDAETIAANEIFKNQLDDCPDKVLLTVIADYVEDNRLSVYSWEGYYEKNDGLEQWYDTLKKIGYKMSTDEQQLLDGTHECFEKREDENENTAAE